jgi:hypothetical protein
MDKPRIFLGSSVGVSYPYKIAPDGNTLAEAGEDGLTVYRLP